MDETKPRIPRLVTGIFFSVGLEIKVSCSISQDITQGLSVDWDERSKLNILGESSEGGKELKTWELESNFLSLKLQIPREFIKDMARFLMSSPMERHL